MIFLIIAGQAKCVAEPFGTSWRMRKGRDFRAYVVDDVAVDTPAENTCESNIDVMLVDVVIIIMPWR